MSNRTASEQCELQCAWKGGGPCLREDCPRRATLTSNPKADALRKRISELRRKPIALVDLIPMLQGSADEIERLQVSIIRNEQRRLELADEIDGLRADLDYSEKYWSQFHHTPKASPDEPAATSSKNDLYAALYSMADAFGHGSAVSDRQKAALAQAEAILRAADEPTPAQCDHDFVRALDFDIYKCEKCGAIGIADETACGHGKWTGLLLIPGVENCIYCGEARAALTPAAAEWPSETQSRDPFTGES